MSNTMSNTTPSKTTLRALALGLAGFALTACGSDETPATAPEPDEATPTTPPASESPDTEGGRVSASCVISVEYDGTLYVLAEGTAEVEQDTALEGAVSPSCNDTPGSDETDLPVDAATISGVDPSYALLATGFDGETSVFVAEEYMTDQAELPADVAAELGLD